MNRKYLSILGTALLAATVIATPSQAADKSEAALDISVEVGGEGRPVITIPGLNSHASVWRETCEALKGVQCHMVQLPGFAGAKPASRFAAAGRPINS